MIVVGGGGGYLLWLKTRPKKMTWKARIYQRGEGVRPMQKDKKGRPIGDIKISDLRPYTKDIIEKIDKEPGITIYRLIKINKTVPAVTAESVDYWGEKDKEVSVLLEGDSCTILKKGYDHLTAAAIFHPMKHDRINMMVSQMAIRKERLRQAKDVLQAITPWVVTGIAILGLVAMTYIVVNGHQESARLLAVGEQRIANSLSAVSDSLNRMMVAQYGEDYIVEQANITLGEPPP